MLIDFLVAMVDQVVAVGRISGEYMDPEAYRIIAFDQRGCGKSRPSAELRVHVNLNIVVTIIL